VGYKGYIILIEGIIDGGSSYRSYIFKESIRRCAIDCKGRGA